MKGGVRTEAQFRVVWYKGRVYLQKRVETWWENIQEDSPEMKPREKLN